MAEKIEVLDDCSPERHKLRRRWNHGEICTLLRLAKQKKLAGQTSSISVRNKWLMEEVTKQLKKENSSITV